MCTIAILVGLADAPVILAANRDELYARPTRPPEKLGPRIVGGRDVLSGGTWMALRDDGQFAAVTNQRALDTPPPGLRSRGLAVMECAAADDQEAYVRALDPTHYASMNLVFGNASAVSVAYLRREGTREILRLANGLYILANDVIGAPGFPRAERLQHLIEAALSQTRSWDTLWPLLARALGSTERSPDAPPSHLPEPIALAMTAINIHTEFYGTRSASLVALQPGRVAAYWTADGPPDTTPFTDKVGLLA
ncbi:MAG: NRDE family protein [Kofleriaceae bacterium]